jgi:hypothetical protein
MIRAAFGENAQTPATRCGSDEVLAGEVRAQGPHVDLRPSLRVFKRLRVNKALKRLPQPADEECRTDTFRRVIGSQPPS